jgi:hypothetical protein
MAHTFSFGKPKDIGAAVRKVQAEIERAGGTFSGNESSGEFRVKGIEGQYSVDDCVAVIITKKPGIIPASIIEKKVKEYFNA